MASLYRLDVMVRKTSDIVEPDAVKWTKDWINDRQEDEKNKLPDGSYKREYYSDLFDARTGKLWKVFSNIAADNRDVNDKYVNGDTEINGVLYISTYIEDIANLQIQTNNNKQHISDLEVIINANNAEVL